MKTPLDLETARQHLAESTDPPLYIYDEITEDAAELLAGSDLEILKLSGLTDIDAGIAARLGAFNGHLLLDGWKEPDPSILDELAERSWKKSQQLCLDGMEEIDPGQARALSKWRGGLELSRIRRITDEVADILSAGHSLCIYLDGLSEISERAFSLLVCGRPSVYLDGLESLPKLTILETLGDKTFDKISFNKVARIDSETLRFFADRTDETLELNGLKRLPQADPDLFSNCGCDLHLDGLEELTNPEVESFAVRSRCTFLSLGGLKTLSLFQAKILAGGFRNRGLSLGLEEINVDTARAIFGSSALDECASLSMNRLKYISTESAALVSKYGGSPLSFDGLVSISDEAFEAFLADYEAEASGEGFDWIPGEIYLDGLKQLTPRMIEALSKTGATVSLKGLQLSEEELALMLSKCERFSESGVWTGKDACPEP